MRFFERSYEQLDQTISYLLCLIHTDMDLCFRLYFTLKKKADLLSVTVSPCAVPIEWSLAVRTLKDKPPKKAHCEFVCVYVCLFMDLRLLEGIFVHACKHVLVCLGSTGIDLTRANRLLRDFVSKGRTGYIPSEDLMKKRSSRLRLTDLISRCKTAVVLL